MFLKHFLFKINGQIGNSQLIDTFLPVRVIAFGHRKNLTFLCLKIINSQIIFNTCILLYIWLRYLQAKLKNGVYLIWWSFVSLINIFLWPSSLMFYPFISWYQLSLMFLCRLFRCVRSQSYSPWMNSFVKS